MPRRRRLSSNLPRSSRAFIAFGQAWVVSDRSCASRLIVHPASVERKGGAKAAASTKPKAAASAEAAPSFSKTAKGHARVTPWIELLRGLLLRTGRALDEAEIALDGSAAHALQVLAECFCRRRWEEAIGAAVHARRVVVLRADVALWAPPTPAGAASAAAEAEGVTDLQLAAARPSAVRRPKAPSKRPAALSAPLLALMQESQPAGGEPQPTDGGSAQQAAAKRPRLGGGEGGSPA